LSEQRPEKVRVEYIIGDPEDPEFHLVGKADRRIIDESLKWLGLRFEPRVEAVPAPRVSCDKSTYCTDYPKKCSECARNEAKSYFEGRVEG